MTAASFAPASAPTASGPRVLSVRPTPPAAPGRDPRRVLTVTEVLTACATGDRHWRARARCADRPAQWWWPDPASSDPSGLRARRVCARCPVLGDCRDAFLAHPGLDGSGIWAGLPGDLLRAAAVCAEAPPVLCRERVT